MNDDRHTNPATQGGHPGHASGLPDASEWSSDEITRPVPSSAYIPVNIPSRNPLDQFPLWTDGGTYGDPHDAIPQFLIDFMIGDGLTAPSGAPKVPVPAGRRFVWPLGRRLVFRF